MSTDSGVERIYELLRLNDQCTMPALYLAGRIEKERLRWGLAEWGNEPPEGCSWSKSWPTPFAIGQWRAVYTGPYSYSCDHGCAHRSGAHGAGDDLGHGCCSSVGESRDAARSRALDGIRHADLVVAWIEDLEAYGTLVEVGYAQGLGKPVVLVTGWDLPELWFAAASCALHVESASPSGALLDLFRKANAGRFAGFNSYGEYLKSEHWQRTRREALGRAGNKCQLCSESSNLNVHHNTYERLGEELPADVIVLCREHHKQFHGITGD